MKFLTAAGVEFIFTIIANVINIPFYYYSLKVPRNDVIKDLIPQVTRQVTHCKTQFAYYDTELGYFAPRNLPDCKASHCPPERPAVINTRFLLSTNLFGERYITYDDPSAFRLLTSESVVIIVHGTFQSYLIDPWFNATKNHWLRLGADVILVDWSAGNKDPKVAAANTQTVGAQTGQLTSYFHLMSRATCVGVGSGAHICGLTGQWLKYKGYPKLAKCTGLDPAGGPFTGCPGNYTLSVNDCHIVNVIHTSYSPDGEGIDKSLGHCDFWINYRTPFDDCDDSQPIKSIHDAMKSSKVHKNGSKMKKLSTNLLVNSLSEKFKCDHRKAMNLYLEQLASYPLTKYSSKPCKNKLDSCGIFTSPKRNSSDDTVNVVKRSLPFYTPKELIREPIPPFDRCTSQDNQDFCLCVRNKIDARSHKDEETTASESKKAQSLTKRHDATKDWKRHDATKRVKYMRHVNSLQ